LQIVYVLACKMHLQPQEAPMRDLSPVDELAELRAEIARLQQREAALCAMLEHSPAPPVRVRAGWPIRIAAHLRTSGARA
jgi:hypothetical protein